MRLDSLYGPVAISLMALASCSGAKESGVGVAVVDMAAAADAPDFSEVTPADVRYVALDTASEALVGESAQLVAIMGDTILIKDQTSMGDNSRLLLFDSATGRYLRTLSHHGEGPGEYNWIESVYPDRATGTVVVKGANDNVSCYTFGDSLVWSKTIPHVGNRKLAVGSIGSCINIAEPFEGNLRIHQYDSRFDVIDTITVAGYEPMYISMSIDNSGSEALMNVVDTLYSILPGELRPVAVLSRGDKALTPEVEKKVYLNQRDHRVAREQRARYIEFMKFLSDGDRLVVFSTYADRDFIDIIELASGRHLAHNSFSYKDEEPGLPVQWGDIRFHVTWIQAVDDDGRFYAIVSDDQAVDADGNPNPDGNMGVISFRLAPSDRSM